MTDTLMNESAELIPALYFGKETTKTLMPDHRPLYMKHVAEVGYFKDDEPEMIWTDYFKIEDVGMLRVFCIRNAAFDLLGYAIYFVRQNPHYASTKIAQCDMIYILPEHRGGTGEKFIFWIDKSLKDEGVNAVSHHAKVYYDFGSMLKRLEYEHVENIYIRRLN